MKIILLFLHLTFAFDPNDVVMSWRKLAWTQVSVLSVERNQLQSESIRSLLRISSRRNISFKAIESLNDLDFKGKVCIFANVSSIKLSLTILSSLPPNNGMLVLPKDAATREIMTLLSDFDKSCAGILYHRNDLYKFMTFRLENRALLEEYDSSSKWNDLRGATFHAGSIEWRPYAVLDGCRESTNDVCRVSGILPEMMLVIQRRFNFTLITRREISGNFGEMPPSHHHNNQRADDNVNNATGLLGRTLSGDVDLALSFWMATLERRRYLDVSVSFESTVHECFIKVDNEGMFDLFLLLKPFKPLVWALIAAFSAVSGILTWLGGKMRAESGVNMSGIASGSCLTLLLAYYGGALTMFLSSTPNWPFTTVRDALLLFPVWKPIVAGIVVIPLLTAVAPEMALQLEQSKEDLVAKDMKHFAEMFAEGEKRFAFAHSVSMGAILAAPGLDVLRIPCSDIRVSHSLLLPKNSPLTPILNDGIRRAAESGIMTQIMGKWKKKVIPEDVSPSPVFSLSFEHTALLFILLLASFVSAITLLCCEMKVHSNPVITNHLGDGNNSL